MGSGGSKADEGLQQQIENDTKNNKVVIYSKSHCPFCVKTKSLLTQAGIKAKIFELDQMSNGSAIQSALLAMTRQRTVPNIFIGGKHIGGNSEIQALGIDWLKQNAK